MAGKTPWEAAMHRRTARLKTYGLTPSMYQTMYDQQHHACAICLVPYPVLVVDHCHANGKVRALLCSACNKALGFFKDDPLIIQAGLEYMLRHQK